MSTLGSYDMSFPGLSVGGGQNSGSSSGSSSGSGTSQQSTQMVPGMLNVYQQLLGLNQQNYNNMRGAYQSQLASNAQALPGVYQGYRNLSSNVMDTLGVASNGQLNGSWGVAAPAAQGIANTYAQGVASNQQQMASAGLGNTSVGSNLNAQAAQQAALSYGQLGSQLAQSAAGYQASIGQAGLGAQMQGLGMQTGLTQAALNPLDTQYANTAGTLTGGFGQSSYSNNSSERSQNQGQQGQGGSSGASDQNPAAGVTGAPGGGAGSGSSGGGGDAGGGGGGLGSAPGYDPASAYGGGSSGGGGGSTSAANAGGGYGGGVPGTSAYGYGGGNYANIGNQSSGAGGNQGTSGSYDYGNGASSSNPYGLSSDQLAQQQQQQDQQEMQDNLSETYSLNDAQAGVAASNINEMQQQGYTLDNIEQVSDTAVRITYNNPGKGAGTYSVLVDSKGGGGSTTASK